MLSVVPAALLHHPPPAGASAASEVMFIWTASEVTSPRRRSTSASISPSGDTSATLSTGATTGVPGVDGSGGEGEFTNGSAAAASPEGQAGGREVGVGEEGEEEEEVVRVAPEGGGGGGSDWEGMRGWRWVADSIRAGRAAATKCEWAGVWAWRAWDTHAVEGGWRGGKAFARGGRGMARREREGARKVWAVGRASARERATHAPPPERARLEVMLQRRSVKLRLSSICHDASRGA